MINDTEHLHGKSCDDESHSSTCAPVQVVHLPNYILTLHLFSALLQSFSGDQHIASEAGVSAALHYLSPLSFKAALWSVISHNAAVHADDRSCWTSRL